MKKSVFISPVFIELIVVTLFLALSTSTVIRLIAKAAEISRNSLAESRALIALEDVMERTKADPGAGSFDENGVCTIAEAAGDVLVTGEVRYRQNEAGRLYLISLTAAASVGEPVSASSGRYVAAGVMP